MWVRVNTVPFRGGVETLSHSAWIEGPRGRSEGRWRRGTIVGSAGGFPPELGERLAEAIGSAESTTRQECDELLARSRSAVRAPMDDECIVVLDRTRGPAQLVVELYGLLVESSSWLADRAANKWFFEAWMSIARLGWQEPRTGWSERNGRRCRYVVFELRPRRDPEAATWTSNSG